MRYIVMLLCTVVLCGACAASMVSKPGTSSSPYAPVNEAGRGGVVKYLNQGIGLVRTKRRESAYKQMFTACNGRYKIDAEGPRAEGSVVTPVGDGAIVTPSEYWYIQFSCVVE